MNRRNLLKLFGLALFEPAIHGAEGLSKPWPNTTDSKDFDEPSVDVQSPYPPKALSTEVAIRGGRPTLLINSQPASPIFYALTDCPGGRWTWEELPAQSAGNFVNQGFRLFQVDVWLSQMWIEPSTINPHLAIEQLKGILRLRSDAAVVLRIHVNAPDWWIHKYKEERTEFCDGPLESPRHFGLQRLLNDDLDCVPQASLASRLWLDDASAALAEFCHKLSTADEGRCVAGMHVACGVFGEWHYWGFVKHDPDNGRAMTSHFREWLKQKYKTNQALKTAWCDPSANFESVDVPGVEARTIGVDGIFRDPARQGRVIDYFLCQHQTIARDIVHFCGVVKKNWPRPIITGTFYGYYFSVFGREAAGGHLDPEEVLNSANVDYLSGPQAYYSHLFRDIGGTGQSRGLPESCRLHGKLWLDEMDQEPLSDKDDSAASSIDLRAHTKPEAITVLRRNVMQGLVHGTGLWFYDFGYSDQSGWWNDPDLLSEIRAEREIFDRYAGSPYHSASDVLAVYSTSAFIETSGAKPSTDLVSWTLTNEISAHLYHTGVGFDQIYLSDLFRIDLGRYRAIVFANTLVLSDAEREWILRHAAQSGRHLIWLYAPGFSNGCRLSIDFLRELTRMGIVRASGDSMPAVRVSSNTLPPALLHGEAYFDSAEIINIHPLFAIDDKSAEIHGHLENSRQAGLASKRFATHTAWFCSVPIQNADVLRAIFRQAGAHIYEDSGDVLHASQDLLLLHSRTGGHRRIRLASGKIIEMVLPSPSTTIFDAKTGQIILG